MRQGKNPKFMVHKLEPLKPKTKKAKRSTIQIGVLGDGDDFEAEDFNMDMKHVTN